MHMYFFLKFMPTDPFEMSRVHLSLAQLANQRHLLLSKAQNNAAKYVIQKQAMYCQANLVEGLRNQIHESIIRL